MHAAVSAISHAAPYAVWLVLPEIADTTDKQLMILASAIYYYYNLL